MGRAIRHETDTQGMRHKVAPASEVDPVFVENWWVPQQMITQKVTGMTTMEGGGHETGMDAILVA